ncbi:MULTISPECIES: SUKH-3 domain-containing protein [unclassified Nonomuraea]|uniref:SUKH-3 domain-containing protein n=1 Tax=unclassified Nonomuraea TaxID=2593643 RepID=UPI0035C01429
MELSVEAELVLRAAGWERGRGIDISEWRSHFSANGIQLHDSAARFLSEFGGLSVDSSSGGGAPEPFELDPSLAYGEEDRFIDWSEVIGHSLYPLGELDGGRFFLGIDEVGRIYLVANWIACYGTIPEGLENLIRGVAPKELYGRQKIDPPD